jgi:hypothetical protein
MFIIQENSNGNMYILGKDKCTGVHKFLCDKDYFDNLPQESKDYFQPCDFSFKKELLKDLVEHLQKFLT